MPLLKPFYRIEPENWWCLDNPNVAAHQRMALADRSVPLEEYVRQWILRELVESYGYPEDWITNKRRIVVEWQGQIGSTEHCADIAILTQWGDPFIIVEVTTEGSTDDPERRAKACLSATDATMGMSTDGTVENTKFFRKRLDLNKFDYILDLEPHTNNRQQVTIPQPISDAGAEPSMRLKPIDERYEDILFKVHSDLRDIDGLHADVALDELCKVIYAKLHDEEHPAEGGKLRLQRGIYGNVEELAASVRRCYRDANEYDVRVYAQRIPEYERSRGVFVEPIKLSSPALARAVEAMQDYTFTQSQLDVKGRAFQKVFGPAIRAGMGQYFTPEPVIRMAVEMVAPTVDDLILDPFCGSGRFLTTSLKYVREHTADLLGYKYHQFAFHHLHGIEKSERMVRVAMTDMRMQGDGHSNIRCTDALLSLANYRDLQPESFSIILTNPPFGSLLGEEARKLLGYFAIAEGKKSAPMEVLALARCFEFLRPGGTLAIVLPDSILSNTNMSYVRDWMIEQGIIKAVVSLPIETFTPYGATHKTSLVIMRKWRKHETRDLSYRTFLARVDNIGYDATGRRRDGSEVGGIVQQFRHFISEVGW